MSKPKGKLYIVGFGSGNSENITEAARKCLQEADIIVGYTEYIKLLRPIYPDKVFHKNGMTQETERCRAAIEFVKEGKNVCLVSSGDSGIYGMASLTYELAEFESDLEIAVIPGVTAAVSGAAILGAPVGHDFAVISLSDLLTPWETIEKRLKSAAYGDFVICIYNPGSRNRSGHLCRTCDVLLETLPSDRLCGVAGNIGREGEYVTFLTLSELREYQAIMTETIFIGNSMTRMINGRMVTPRGWSLHND